MSYEFEQFAASLEDEERSALYSAVPFLTALVAHADGHYSFSEKIARWKSFIRTKTDLDPSFVSKEAIADVDQHLKKIHREMDSLSHEEVEARVRKELRRLRQIMRRMPSSLKSRYEGFLLEECMGVAKASRGFLWVGDELSEEEREMLRMIIAELQITISDRELRDSLALDDEVV
jgi:hypothetical protein